jgi:hypothetical protein
MWMRCYSNSPFTTSYPVFEPGGRRSKASAFARSLPTLSMEAVGKLRRLYPGHYDPERLVFIRDSSTKAIVKTASPSVVSNSECLRIAGQAVPDGALQLIRIRAREPDKANPSPTRGEDIDTLLSLFNILGFPISSVLFARQSPRVEFGRLLGYPGDSDERPIFYVTGSRLCLVWSHDVKSCSTSAVMVNFTPNTTEDNMNFPMAFEAFLQPYAACFGHPMLLAMVLVHFVQSDALATYAPDSHTLRQIEHRVTVKAASRIDTMQRLRDLGRTSVKDKYVLSTLKKIMEFSLEVEEYFSQENPTFEARQLKRTFHWHINQRIHLIDIDISFLESITDSVSNQIASISAIINMQDGASMKTMATITMLFLPGTFVASFFAMPMFEWNNDLGHIVSRQFWIYWAVAVPLTVTVFLAWLAWWYWHNLSKQYDSPGPPTLADIWAQLWGTFRTGAKNPKYQVQNPFDRLSPLHSDNVREFEDKFYDFEYEEPRGDSITETNPSLRAKLSLRQETV